MHFHRVALNFVQDVEEIASVEADLDRVAAVVGGDFLGRCAAFGIGSSVRIRPKPIEVLIRLDWPMRPRCAASPVSESSKQPHDFFDTPNVIRNASFHRWRDSERLMHTPEVVIHEV